MTTHRTISFRIATEKVDELDALAKAMDRDRSYLLNEAMDNYLQYQQESRAQIEKGLEDIREGRWLDHEVVVKRMEARIRERTGQKRRKSA